MDEDLPPHVIRLSPSAWEKFCHALANPKPPTEALKRLMQRKPRWEAGGDDGQSEDKK